MKFDGKDREREENALINEIRFLKRIDLNDIALALPMSREDHDGFGLDFLSNFLSDLLELRVDWVVFFIHDVWLITLSVAFSFRPMSQTL